MEGRGRPPLPLGQPAGVPLEREVSGDVAGVETTVVRVVSCVRHPVLKGGRLSAGNTSPDLGPVEGEGGGNRKES